MPRPTNYELYTQAVAQLTEAADALDQAHATMRDIGYEDTLSSYTAVRGRDAGELFVYVIGLVKELGEAECAYCFHPLKSHGDQYGCEYERGDRPEGEEGMTVLVARGPCGCKWGQQVRGEVI